MNSSRPPVERVDRDAEVPELRPHKFRRDDPLDALRKLQRATAARWTGTERVRWTTCRRRDGHGGSTAGEVDETRAELVQE